MSKREVKECCRELLISADDSESQMHLLRQGRDSVKAVSEESETMISNMKRKKKD